MSAAQAARAAAAEATVVARDPDRDEWLVLGAAAVGGMLTLLVAGHHATRAAAERAAGFHGKPAAAWLLHDPVLGWRRQSGHGWVSSPQGAGRWTEAEAAAIAADTGLELMVIRLDGRITCPDAQP